MDDKTQTQLVVLSLLGTINLLFGRSKRLAAAIGVLQVLVTEHWDELWSIWAKAPKPPVPVA